jgi:polyisoprenoid-binding protein YceI
MFRSTFFIALILVGFNAQAAVFNQVKTADSSLTFVSSQMGVPVEGRFKQFEVQLQFDPAHAETAQAQITIPVSSIDAGSAEATDEVKGKSWFNVVQFPTVKFVAKHVKAIDSTHFNVTGDMTIKDKTVEVSAPFSLKAVDSAALLDGHFELKRSQFGLGSGSWAATDVVADEVKIRFTFKVSSLSSAQ